MADVLNTFVEEIKKAYGHNLKSVILYGSKASGEDTEKHSDYNVLIVLENLAFEDLQVLNPATARWVKRGNPPPLLFKHERLIKSADVFPIEFLDMKDGRKVLYGEDPFSNLEIKDTHLRHECEFELKGKLLKLRQGYMAFAHKPAEVRKLLIASLSAFLVLFKHTVRLFGEVPPAKKTDALAILARKTGLRSEVFQTVMRMKQGDKQALRLKADDVMQEYLSEIEKIIDVVDDM